MKIQACIGNQLNRMHLRDADTTRVMNGDLVLCGAVAAFKDYRGPLLREKLCDRCMRKFVKTFETHEPVTAELLGVSELR